MTPQRFRIFTFDGRLNLLKTLQDDPNCVLAQLPDSGIWGFQDFPPGSNSVTQNYQFAAQKNIPWLKRNVVYTNSYSNASYYAKLRLTPTYNQSDSQGGTGAVQLLETAVTNTFYIQYLSQGYNVPAGIPVIVAVDVKGISRDYIAITGGYYNGMTGIVYFNTANGSYGTVSGSWTALSPINLGNGWWRIFAKGTTVSDGSNVFEFTVYPAPSNGTLSYAGDTSKGILVGRHEILFASALPSSYTYQDPGLTWDSQYSSLAASVGFPVGIWQDAGTTSVNTSGQSVYRCADSSGKGHTTNQSSGTNRPLWKRGELANQAYFQGDGDDSLSVTLPNLGNNCVEYVADQFDVLKTTGLSINGQYSPLTRQKEFGRILFANGAPTYEQYLIKWLKEKRPIIPLPQQLVYVSSVFGGLIHDEAGGSITNTSSASTVIDVDGVSRSTKANEIRFRGARRLENRLSYTQDFSNAIWVSQSAGTGTAPVKTPNFAMAPDGTTTACRLQFNKGAGTTSGDYSQFSHNSGPYSGANECSVWARTNDGSTKVLAMGNTTDTWKVTITPIWRQVRSGPTATLWRLFCRGGYGVDTSADILIWHPFLEEIASSQYNYAPQGYISKNAGDSFNSGIDGVRYFTTKNNNAIQGNAFDDITAYAPNLSGITFYDDFHRSDTSAGSLGQNYQGFSWDLRGAYVSSFPLPAATDGFISANQYRYGANSTVYATQTLRDTVRRIGCRIRRNLLHSGQASVTTVVIIVSANDNFISDMLHITVDYAQALIQIREAGGSFITLATITASPIKSYNADMFVDISISADGQTVTLSYDGQTANVTDSRISALIGKYVAWEQKPNAIESSMLDTWSFVSVWATEDNQAEISQNIYDIPSSQPIADIGIIHNGDAIKMPALSGVNVPTDKCAVILKIKMTSTNSINDKQILAFNTGATDFIYDNGAGGIAISDGTNSATSDVGGWAIGDYLLICACYDTTQSSLYVAVSKNNGSWIESSTSFDGSLSIGSYIYLANGNTSSMELYALKIYKYEMNFTDIVDWLKSRAISEAI